MEISIPELLGIVLAASYVVGATPFGYLAGKLKGIDIREHGSGNVGATNVIRVLGKSVGIPVFAADFCKGLVPVLLVQWCARKLGLAGDAPGMVAAAGAVLGHNFPFWLKFRGGKGIATSAGALAALLPWPLLCAVVVWLLVFLGSRYVALGSLAAAVALPAAALVLRWRLGAPSGALCWFAVALGALAIWRHRSNIRRLLDGTENRFERRAKGGRGA